MWIYYRGYPMYKNFIPVFVLFISVAVACERAEERSEITELPDRASQISEKIKGGALIVDVRTPEEFASGAYPGAINIPLQIIADNLDKFGPKNRSIVVYCRSGSRSRTARVMLRRAGFSDVTDGGSLAEMNEFR